MKSCALIWAFDQGKTGYVYPIREIEGKSPFRAMVIYSVATNKIT